MTAQKPDVQRFGLYTCKQAAGLLGVDYHTIMRWRRNGRLVPHTADGRFLGQDILDVWKGKL